MDLLDYVSLGYRIEFLRSALLVEPVSYLGSVMLG